MASQQLAQKFKDAIAEDFDKEVSLDDASRMLSDLVGYFDLLAKLRHQITDQNHGSKKSN